MDIYAVGVIVGIIATFVAVIVFWITYIILLLNFKREPKSDLQELKTDLKADIKAGDDRLRLVEGLVNYIRGFLVGRMPGFSSKEDLDTPTA